MGSQKDPDYQELGKTRSINCYLETVSTFVIYKGSSQYYQDYWCVPRRTFFLCCYGNVPWGWALWPDNWTIEYEWKYCKSLHATAPISSSLLPHEQNHPSRPETLEHHDDFSKRRYFKNNWLWCKYHS